MATCSDTTKLDIPQEINLNTHHDHNHHHHHHHYLQQPRKPKSDPNPYDRLNISLNRDGTLTRHHALPTIKPNLVATRGDSTVSKDLPLNPQRKTSLRLYRPTKLPSNDNTVARLPIIVFFHGGGFVLLSAASKTPHQFCSRFAGEAPAIVVSVDYRLAPENKLPAQYDDALEAIMWVRDQGKDGGGEQWIREFGDFSRCYLCGRGCGGNIVLNAALKALDLGLDLRPLKISGLVLNQPMFGGLERTKSELESESDRDDRVLPLSVMDLLWDLALPAGTDRDHPFCNPVREGARMRRIGELGRCLVIGFCGDPLIGRMEELVNVMVRCGVKVESRLHDGGFHDIDVVDEQWAYSVLNIVKEFVI